VQQIKIGLIIANGHMYDIVTYTWNTMHGFVYSYFVYGHYFVFFIKENTHRKRL